MNALSDNEVAELQRGFCEQQESEYVPARPQDIGGFATTTTGMKPLNGLRHPQSDSASGWYLWCGETFSSADDFFQPTHLAHVYDEYPAAVRLLGLAPGFRFLLSGDYLDICSTSDCSIFKETHG